MEIATAGTQTIDPQRVRNPLTGKLVDAIRQTSWRSVIRPRTLVYFVGWSAIGLAMLTALSLRSPLDLNVLHDRNPQYVQLQDGSIRNGYDLKVLNMTPEPRVVTLSMRGLDDAAMSLAGSTGEPTRTLTLELEPDKVLPLRLYVRAAPAELTSTSQTFQLVVESTDGQVRAAAEAKFESPER